MYLKRDLLVFAAMCGAIMEVVDMSIVNVAIPDMQGSMSASPDQISWVLTSYLVSTAIFLPVAGFFSDIWGRKRFFLICTIGFTISSITCGASEQLSHMIISRLVQGAFGAGLVPLSQTITAHAFPPAERHKAMTIWVTGILLGPIIGPTLGGIIIEYMNWRWIFYMNVPICVLSMLLIMDIMEETEIIRRRLDWIGTTLLAIGVGCLQFTLDRGHFDDWFESKIIRTTTALSIGGIALYIYYTLKYCAHPIFDLRVFKDRNFTGSTIIMTFIGISLFGVLVIQPLMMTYVFGYTAIDIGFSMVPRDISTIVTLVIVGKIIGYFPTRNFIALGIIVNIISAYLAGSRYNTAMTTEQIIIPFVVQGVGLGLIFGPLATQALITMPKALVSDATIIFNLMRVIGSATGIALSVTYFTHGEQHYWQYYSAFVNSYNPNLTAYLQHADLELNSNSMAIVATEIVKQAQMQAVNNVFYAFTVFFIVLFPLVFLLNKVTVKEMALDALE